MRAEDSFSIFELCDTVRETAYALHKYLGHGHLEKVYENALRNRLVAKGLVVHSQFALSVFDEDGTKVGNYFADLWLENRLIIELKACATLSPEHTAQLLNYLKSSRVKHGLLINFGSPRFQIRKYIFGFDP